MERYLSPGGYGEAELVEKRSRFIARVAPVDSEDAAKEEIAKARARYHDASHNCWCYIIRGGQERYSDDGEPQGTAGLPMLEVFSRGGIFNVCCVVTRYFGGTLLGAGGLSRAYSSAARSALANAGIIEYRLCECLEVVCQYSSLGRIKTELENSLCLIEGVEYGETVVFRVIIPDGVSDSVIKRLKDISAGTVSCAVTGKRYSCRLPDNR